MNRKLRDNLTFIALFTLLSLFIVDCSRGSKRYCPGVVQGHVYMPAYTTTRIVTDDKGNTSTAYDYHPEEYRLLIECEQPQHVANVEVSGAWFAMIKDQQSVVVGERVGRWTKIIWFQWIEKTQISGGAY